MPYIFEDKDNTIGTCIKFAFCVFSDICSPITTSTELTAVTHTNGTTTHTLYTCALNYTLSGEHAHICDAAGTWNYQRPSCGTYTS